MCETESAFGRTLVVLLSGCVFVLCWLMLSPGFANENIAGAGRGGVESNAESLVAIRSIHVFPESVALTYSQDIQSLVVQAVLDNGLTVDVTQQVDWKIEDKKIAGRDSSTIIPLSDGETKLRVTHAGQEVLVPVKVTGARQQKPISFKLDVMPIFMKAGCNAGGCHGAARGKDGFRLSLFGFDADGDYHRLTRELVGRRIDLAAPEESLLIKKAIGAVPHSGGGPIKKESEYYRTLLQWLEAGANNDHQEVPQVVQLELFPSSAVLDGPGASQQLTVRAIYDDGSDRDVTALAFFSSNNEDCAKVSQSGLVTAGSRGESFVMCRFETQTVGVPVITLPKDNQFAWQEVPENNYIDTLVHQKLKTIRVQPSGLCSDRVFIRRASVDICGVLPTAQQVAAFESDASPDKRAALIDRLLDRKEFVDIWVMKWSELLQVRSSQRVSPKATLLYYQWLKNQIASNVPIDELVLELLAAEGGTFSNPAANYYQNEVDPLKTGENVAQVFLGMRLQCAQCHNHPFDRWTMDDYYSFAAFFAQIGRKRSSDPRETIVFNRGGGERKHPVTKKNMAPKFLGGAAPETKGKDRREVLAKWIGSKENPYFAKNLANIVWSHFFGRGIVHEVDDVRTSNPPSNAALLDELAVRFADYDFDFKSLVRDICNSRTYQLSTQTNSTNETDSTNFSHGQLRRIRAEVLLDMISQVTETKNKFAGLPLGARAVQIADGNTSNYFLKTFGRAQRTTVCSCEVKMEPSLSQALHLINGATVHEKIKRGNLVQRLLDQEKTPSEIVEMLYLRSLGRKPLESEWAAFRNDLANAEEDVKKILEDIFWALLNSREFVFNH